MAVVTKVNPVVANAVGEIRNIGKEITMISVDWDVDADASREAMEAVHNTISARANILAAGAVYDTGTKQDFILEGTYPGSDYVSVDGTVTSTVTFDKADNASYVQVASPSFANTATL